MNERGAEPKIPEKDKFKLVGSDESGSAGSEGVGGQAQASESSSEHASEHGSQQSHEPSSEHASEPGPQHSSEARSQHSGRQVSEVRETSTDDPPGTEATGSAFDNLEPVGPPLNGVDTLEMLDLNMEKEPEKPKREGIAKTFGIVALLNFLSKFIGLARDIVVAHTFGTSLVADSYNYAYMFTGNILVLFGGQGGPFHSASVSILAARKESEGTRRLIGQLLMLTFFSLSLISLVVFIAAPYLIQIVVPANGLSEADRLRLQSAIVPHLRIMTPLIVIAGLVGLGAGISNTYREFTWPSLSPAVASLTIIIAALYFPDPAAICLAVGTLIGAIGQLVVQLPGIFKSRPKFELLFTPQPGLKEYLFMIGPAAIGTSIGQLNVYIDSFFVSSLSSGSWTAIQYANRLLQLPLGVMLTAMLVPILPRFTEQVAAREIEELKAEFRKALRILWFTVLPLVTTLLAMPNPIIKLLFERGQFNDESRALVISALLFLVPSAFFYVVRDLLTRAFYAHQDSKTPFKVAMLSIVVKAAADWALVGPLGLGGIALSTTLVTIFNMCMLSNLLKKKIGPLGTSKLIRPAIIMLAASGLCGVSAHYAQIFVTALIHVPGSFGKLAGLVVSITVAGTIGMFVYVVSCMVMKLDEPKQVLIRMKRFALGLK